MSKPVILTGLRANNNLTLGNYFGGIKPMIEMAKSHAGEYQLNMFIPDLHSFTTPIDHATLYQQTLQTAEVFVAAGLPLNNPDIFMYRQSFIPAHSELTWILDCFTGFGQMERMTQFKDKSAQASEVSVGLFNYPVLMAADILLYGAQYVPVGDDQTQHLEFTRDIAERMNSRFGDTFVVPEPVPKQHEFFGRKHGIRLKDLANPAKKMSKSDESGKGVLFLSDTPDEARKKIMSATTDDRAQVAYDPVAQPGVSNLLEILSLLREVPVQEVAAEFENMTKYGEFKAIVADEIVSFLVRFHTARAEVQEDDVLRMLTRSEKAMNEQANETLYRVQQAVGLRSRDW